MHQPDLPALRTAALQGDSSAALRALLGTSHGCLRAQHSEEAERAAAAALLTVYAQDGGNTLLHYVCAGEPVGLGGGLLLWLARWRPAGGSWPAQEQRARAQLLVQLLARQPRLALLAGCCNAAGDSPLHAAVRSQSTAVLAVLLAALQQLLACAATGPATAATALQLLLSVQNAEGLTALEVAVRERQWAAARLLASTAAGAPLLSQAQMEVSSLVQHYLGLAGGSRPAAAAAAASASSSSSSAAAAAGQSLSTGPIQVSASGSSVAEAAGKLLSKLWDAWGTAVAEQAAEAATDGGGAGGSGQQRLARAGPLPLVAQALGQANVLALVRQEEQEQEQRASAAAALAAAHGSCSGGAPGAAAAAAVEAAASSGSLRQCIVCYDELPPGWLSTRVRCGHAVCDQCWRGILQAAIDEGDPRRAMCPQPRCGAALPLSSAARLLPLPALQRYQRLVAGSYLSTHPQSMRACPLPACGATLHLPGPALKAAAAKAPAAPGEGSSDAMPEAAAAAEAAAGAAGAATAAATAAAVPGAGVDAECGACGHLLCWRCGEEAHEPASCEQVRLWGEELAALRRAAPDADRQWLASHTKRCPKCRAHIQKHGGCNHMTCKSCGMHFCWQCGLEWSQHSMETGGYYHCAIQQRSDLPEYSGAGAGDDGAGWLGGPFAWVASVWGSIKAVAQQHQLQRHLHQFLRLSGSPAGLFAAAAQMERLLQAAGVAAAAPPPPSAAAAAVGPELLGVSVAEARRMDACEWGQLVAAAAASAADAAALPARLDLAAAQAAAGAALAAAASPSTGGGGGSSGSLELEYLWELAAALASARRLLQHAAVALYQLPSGPPRRHLQQLSGSIQRWAEQLEPLLLALPERDALPPAERRRQPQQPQQQQQPQSGGQREGSGQQPAAAAGSEAKARSSSSSSSSGGTCGWLLRKLWGVELPPPPAADAPECHPAVAGLSGGVVLQQVQFAVAVHAQRAAIRRAMLCLLGDMAELRTAARSGLYS